MGSGGIWTHACIAPNLPPLFLGDPKPQSPEEIGVPIEAWGPQISQSPPRSPQISQCFTYLNLYEISKKHSRIKSVRDLIWIGVFSEERSAWAGVTPASLRWAAQRPAPRGARIAFLPARAARTFTIHPPPAAGRRSRHSALDVQVCCACSPCQRHFYTSRVHVLHDPACRMA